MSDLTRLYGLHETFGPKPPERRDAKTHVDVARLRGMLWFYETGTLAPDETVKGTIEGVSSSIPSKFWPQCIKAWREGEKAQAALSGHT